MRAVLGEIGRYHFEQDRRDHPVAFQVAEGERLFMGCISKGDFLERFMQPVCERRAVRPRLSQPRTHSELRCAHTADQRQQSHSEGQDEAHAGAQNRACQPAAQQIEQAATHKDSD